MIKSGVFSEKRHSVLSTRTSNMEPASKSTKLSLSFNKKRRNSSSSRRLSPNKSSPSQDLVSSPAKTVSKPSQVRHSSTPSPTFPSLDSQPTPGQRVRAVSPVKLVAKDNLSRIASTVVTDELIIIEKQVVAWAILEEKKLKLRGMVENTREIPRELRAVRSWPSLGPLYKFSAQARLEIDEMVKEQDRKYVEMLLKDLEGTVIPEIHQDTEDALECCRRRIRRKVNIKEATDAVNYFDEEAAGLFLKDQELLQKRRPSSKKRKSAERQEDSRRPSKRPRYHQHHHQHQKKRSWQKKPGTNKRQ